MPPPTVAGVVATLTKSRLLEVARLLELQVPAGGTKAIQDHEHPHLDSAPARLAFVAARLRSLFRKNWPGSPWPVVHYDPRPVEEGLFASLHAKCVVVDDAEALVTSANFTHRAQTRNVEVGALVRDPRYAKALAAQWHNARNHGMFATLDPAVLT